MHLEHAFQVASAMPKHIIDNVPKFKAQKPHPQVSHHSQSWVTAVLLKCEEPSGAGILNGILDVEIIAELSELNKTAP